MEKNNKKLEILNNHQKLKIICEIIGHNYENLGFRYYSNTFTKDLELGYRVVHINEIIFTNQFKSDFEDYYYGKLDGSLYKFDSILDHLDYPVSFLYQLLEKKQQIN